MAEAVQESKCDVSVPYHEGQAAGEQPSSAAGARGGETAEAKARPNVEVNRRAEGTSELNRRLGAVGQGAAALEHCDVAGDYGWGLAGKQARCACSVSRRSSSRPAIGAKCLRRVQMAKQTGQRRRSARAWNVEAKPRPNVEVNRRAEGTSELNRRLGAVGQGAAALERCGVAGDYGRGWAGWQAACCAVALQESKLDAPVPLLEGQAAGQQPGNSAGARGGGAPTPNRGLT